MLKVIGHSIYSAAEFFFLNSRINNKGQAEHNYGSQGVF